MTGTDGSLTYLRIRWTHLHDAGNRGIRAAWRSLTKETK